MEFKFNVNDVFKEPIVEINNNLIPPGFSGDRRALWDTVGKVSEVVNAMGEASAAAQNLTKPITTAERLRNSEHRLYLLIDQAAHNGKGAVTGMLKTGTKGLYVFDREGQHYQVSPSCVLDFYVHESRQRNGLGKQLFEHMLMKEDIQPVKMAIDRPSEKFLGFLNKHYQLNTPVKQMNNYVVFDDFFPKSPEKSNVIEADNSGTSGKKESANGLQSFSSPYGRYGAPRPPCSMGQIIHNQTSTINTSQEATGVQSMPVMNYQGMQDRSLNPNSNITQSTPNINYGEQVVNQNEILNSGQYQNQINEANHNMMVNSSSINDIQNQTSATNNNYQEYNVAQATNNAIQNQYQNQYPVQTHASQVYYNNAQNIPNQYPAQNGIIQNMPTKMEQPDAQVTNVQEPKIYQQQNYNSQPNENYRQENPYQNTLEQSQSPQANYWADPKVVYSQPNNNANYIINQQQQQQLQQNQMVTPQQSYPNLNRQFENININNQLLNQEILSNTNANYPQQLQYAPLNTQPSNMKMLSETQSMYQDPKSVFTTQPGTPAGYIQPQGNSAGDYVTNNLHSGMESNQNQWNQQNLLKTPQYQPYNLNQPNSNINMNNAMMQNLQYINDFVTTSQSGFPQHVPLTENRQIIAPQSVQDIGRQMPYMQSNQQQVRPMEQDNTTRQYYQNNLSTIEPLQSNQPNQQFKSIEQHNIRKYASEPVVPTNINPPYVHSNQIIPEQSMPTYSYSARNLVTNPVNQISSQGMPHQSYNQQNQNVANTPFIHHTNQPPSQQITSSHGISQQSYNSQNPHMANNQFVHHTNNPNQQQNAALPQTTYSAGYLPPTPQTQESRRNIPNDSYSAPNVSQRNNQNNTSIMDNAHSQDKNTKNNEINGIVQNNPKQQKEGDQNGKRQMRALDDEVNLSYGYPPQCAMPQPITRANPISIRQPF